MWNVSVKLQLPETLQRCWEDMRYFCGKGAVRWAMKYLIVLGAVAAGIGLVALLPPERPRPVWWQWTVIGLVTLLIVVVLMPPLGGSIADAVVARRLLTQRPSTLPLMSAREVQHLVVPEHAVPILVRCMDSAYFDTAAGVWRVRVEDRRRQQAILLFATEPPAALLRARSAIVVVEPTDSDTVWVAQRVTALAPWIVMPYIPGLGERARILYFHVPMAWIAVLAYAVGMLAALRYLRRRQTAADTQAVAAAVVGTVATVLATLTGAIWARFNWGSFWNWDPRQTTIVVLLLIYLAYFALRASLPAGERRAQLGSVYLVFAFVTVPFLVFVLPRLMESLHPGGSGDTSLGPIIDPSPETLHVVKQLLFAYSLLAFTALFGWLWSCLVRLLRLSEAVQGVTER